MFIFKRCEKVSPSIQIFFTAHEHVHKNEMNIKFFITGLLWFADYSANVFYLREEKLIKKVDYQAFM